MLRTGLEINYLYNYNNRMFNGKILALPFNSYSANEKLSVYINKNNSFSYPVKEIGGFISLNGIFSLIIILVSFLGLFRLYKQIMNNKHL
jgi:hypothetical protein